MILCEAGFLAHPIIHALSGKPLGSESTRKRSHERIGGCTQDPTYSTFQVDWDACWLDGQRIESQHTWESIITADRLADVRGAFVLVWKKDDAWHLVRDGIGERTLFYAQTQPTKGLIFASSIHAILASGLVPRKLRLASVARYLTYGYLPGRETLVEGVYELLPGEHLTFFAEKITSRFFWQLPPEAETFNDTEELRQRLRDELEFAVRRRLPDSDEPVGAFLSGGLDSSLVVALARKMHGGSLKTYSVSFGSQYANELPFSSLVAEHCGTDHRIVELSPEVVLHHLDDSIGLLSEPIGDPLTVPNALLFREASNDVGIVLNGEGGDPCFGGPKNLPMVLAELYNRPSREQSYLRAHLKCYDDFADMLSPDVLDVIKDSPLESELVPLFRDSRWRGFVTKLQALNILFKGPHHILPKVDALSFPFGVLPRSPLFDQDIVEFSFAIPPNLKLHGSVEKFLLKQSVRDLLPQTILDRPKSGMLVPVEGWFQGPLLNAAKERLLDGLTKYRLIERDYLGRLLSGQLGGLRPRHGVKIWLLITLEAWLRKMLT